ncbi:MAG TPA: twin-arginine translocase TatA/TatE family subunit [Candidatus Sulfotelmatobacter sp.]
MISAALFFLVLALIVFGPKKTIELSQSLGRILAQAKHASAQFQSQLNEEISTRQEPSG